MKKAVIVLVGIAVVIGIAVVVALTATSGMTESAQAFFKAIKEENYTGAYEHLSEEFRASTTQEEFVAFLDNSALMNFSEASWGSRSISGGIGELDGSITTEAGGVVPIRLGLVKENDTWKIYSIHKPRAGVARQESAVDLPSAEALVSLVDKTMLEFAESVNAGDFSGFYAHVSNLWRKQSSVEEFNDIFRSFIEADINLLPALERHTPVFEREPKVDGEGVLVLEGHYPTQPSRLWFELKYLYEGIGWKVVGINVNLQ